MTEIIKPKNYEIVSYEESYDDGGFMDNSPKWQKILAIAGIVVAGLEIVGGFTYCVCKSGASTASTNNGWTFLGPADDPNTAINFVEENGWEKYQIKQVGNKIYTKPWPSN